MRDLISVVVPIYNAELYIEKCIESITCQTYQNIEIILVNDGSTDKSLEICMEYMKRDLRIKVLTQYNHGNTSARKKGIAYASGKYLCFVDSDDWIKSETIEYMHDCMVQNKADLIMVSYCRYDKDNSTKRNYVFDEKLFTDEMGKQELYKTYFETEGSKGVKHNVCKNIELIVINDGSNDDGLSERIVKSYGQRIRYIWKENGGVASALNCGIDAARGEYIARMDADDISLKDRIKIQVEYMEKHLEVGVCATQYEYLCMNGRMPKARTCGYIL